MSIFSSTFTCSRSKWHWWWVMIGAAITIDPHCCCCCCPDYMRAVTDAPVGRPAVLLNLPRMHRYRPPAARQHDTSAAEFVPPLIIRTQPPISRRAVTPATARHWRQPLRGCRGHIPPIFWLGGDVNGNIPANIITYFWI